MQIAFKVDFIKSQNTWMSFMWKRYGAYFKVKLLRYFVSGREKRKDYFMKPWKPQISCEETVLHFLLFTVAFNSSEGNGTYNERNIKSY